MRLFILGAGYIGLAILTHWKNKNDSLWASTTNPEKISILEDSAERAFLLKGNDKEQLTAILKECDGLIICVAPGSGANYRQTYLETAQTIAEVLKTRKKPFYLLYTSSTSVYGNHAGKVVNEESERLVCSENGKILCETEDVYLSIASSAVTVCIMRLAGIYGPGRTLENRVRAMSGRTISMGNDVTNHIHRDDIVNAIEYAFQYSLKGIYNLANEDHRPRKIIYDDFCQKMGIPPPQWDVTMISEHGSNCEVSNKKILGKNFTFRHPFL